MTQSISQPLRQKERIRFIDAVRGLALLGILLMNSMAQSQAHFFYMDMDLSQPVTGPNFWAWVVEAFLFEGTMRGLFSILFGAGTILLLNRLEKQKPGLEPADIYYRRLLWLLVFGLIIFPFHSIKNYKRTIVYPLSVIIALIASYWTIERIFFV